jgi:hypothetical protein
MHGIVVFDLLCFDQQCRVAVFEWGRDRWCLILVARLANKMHYCSLVCLTCCFLISSRS